MNLLDLDTQWERPENILSQTSLQSNLFINCKSLNSCVFCVCFSIVLRLDCMKVCLKNSFCWDGYFALSMSNEMEWEVKNIKILVLCNFFQFFFFWRFVVNTFFSLNSRHRQSWKINFFERFSCFCWCSSLSLIHFFFPMAKPTDDNWHYNKDTVIDARRW